MAPPTTYQTPLPHLGTFLALLSTILLIGLATLACFLPPLLAYQIVWHQIRESAPRAATPHISPAQTQRLAAILRTTATKPGVIDQVISVVRGRHALEYSEGIEVLSVLLVSLYTDGPAAAVGTLDQQLASLLNSLSPSVAQEATQNLLPLYERLKDTLQRRTAIDEQRDETDKSITSLFLRCRGLREDLQVLLELREPIEPATNCAFYDAVILQNLPTIAAFPEAPTTATQFIATLRSLSPSLNLADAAVENKIQKRLASLKEVGQTIRRDLTAAKAQADNLTAERTTLEQAIYADVPSLASTLLSLLKQETTPSANVLGLDRLATGMAIPLRRLIPP